MWTRPIIGMAFRLFSACASPEEFGVVPIHATSFARVIGGCSNETKKDLN